MKFAESAADVSTVTPAEIVKRPGTTGMGMDPKVAIEDPTAHVPYAKNAPQDTEVKTDLSVN